MLQRLKNSKTAIVFFENVIILVIMSVYVALLTPTKFGHNQTYNFGGDDLFEKFHDGCQLVAILDI